jgi:CubicO group peptidase (beta-lactamase class C family)
MAADLKSSAQDLYAWMQANLQAPLQSNPSDLQNALIAATTPYPLGSPDCENGKTVEHMGLAWQVDPLFDGQGSPNPQMIWKDGLTPAGGCSSWIGMIPSADLDTQLGVAILVNGFQFKEGSPDNIIADTFGKNILQGLWVNLS